MGAGKCLLLRSESERTILPVVLKSKGALISL